MSRPADKDVEVHLFGPGYGESILVHLGFNEWLIVDSCVDRKARVPAPIAYLEGTGIDPSTAVKVVVASHWHDDHVRGLSKVLSICKGAEFWCSGALFDRDFVALMGAVTRRPMTRAGSGVDEFRAIVDELRARAASTGRRLSGIGLNFADSDKLIWQRPGPTDHPAAVHSLSPSSAERLRSLETIAGLLNDQTSKSKRPRSRIPSVGPNNTAVALHISVGPAAMLLGADLEEIGNPPLQDCGWTAVVSSNRRPDRRCTLLKVPHHGSATAHCDAVWTELMANDPLAILTPFRNGSVRLPTVSDTERLRARARDVYITARQATRKAKPANPVVARQFAQTARAVWEVSAMGHIKASIRDGRANDGWTVATFGPAAQL